MNVLLVDDEVSFRMLMQDCLSDEGFTVFLAEDGQEGMSRLAEAEIDIVISDIHMHVMDGITFCKTARSDPEFRDIPFLFVSAYADKEIDGVISSLKHCAFLSKGRPMSELLQLIRQLTHGTPGRGDAVPAAEVPSPQVAAAPPPTGATRTDPAGPKAVPEHPRVLVVDDDDAFRMLLDDLLSKEGFLVTPAADGQGAIDLLREQKFDLVLSDIMMPNTSGYGVLTYMKENAISTKVIMLTAYSELKLAVECKELGADDFIAKPFMRGDLLTTIRQVLAR